MSELQTIKRIEYKEFSEVEFLGENGFWAVTELKAVLKRIKVFDNNVVKDFIKGVS